MLTVCCVVLLRYFIKCVRHTC